MLCSVWWAVIWTVWNHRNDVIFRDEEVQMHKAMEMVKLKSWQWLNARKHNFSYSLYEWYCDSLSCIQFS
uniref:Uncharacterized protein n=1 Tax=Lotus japonicus TaxID=34305 RepID=I3S669_LOTJA|nr:unknown [Lotus japonicus]